MFRDAGFWQALPNHEANRVAVAPARWEAEGRRAEAQGAAAARLAQGARATAAFPDAAGPRDRVCARKPRTSLRAVSRRRSLFLARLRPAGRSQQPKDLAHPAGMAQGPIQFPVGGAIAGNPRGGDNKQPGAGSLKAARRIKQTGPARHPPLLLPGQPATGPRTAITPL